jgi:hypothetical protein
VYTVKELKSRKLKLARHVDWIQEIYTNFWWGYISSKVVTWKTKKKVGRHH